MSIVTKSVRVLLALTVVLMALTPVIGAVTASLPPETYANMRAYYSHASPQTIDLTQTSSSRDSSRAPVKYFDISLSLSWDGTSQDFSNWQTEVHNANKLLYDATDGQVAFRKVDIYNNRQKWDSVDIHVNSGSGRAYTIRGGIQWSGAYIELYNNNDLDMGGRVIVHEWGHFGMFLPDEYTDSHGPFCRCIQGTTYDTNEWCCENTHCDYDPTFCNANGEAQSCWKQMPQYYPAMTEKNPPTAGPYDAPVPQFVWHFPDLYTSSNNIQITPVNPKEGDQVSISVDIFNKESLVKTNVDVTFYDDAGSGNVLIGSKGVYVSGFQSSLSYTWTAKGGTHLLSAIIDAGNIVKESNEANNTALLNVKVNAPPVISSNLKELKAKEDTDMVVDMSKYESDAEDGTDNSSLKWTVIERDSKVITKVTGENSADDILTFSVPLHWSGKTKVKFALTDSVKLTATKEVDLVWEAINDRPYVDSIIVITPSIFRTETTTIKLTAVDIEEQIGTLSPQLEYKVSSGDFWSPLTMTLMGDAYEGTLLTDEVFAVGMYDIKGRVTDSGGLPSDWFYLNGTLEVKNNPPEVQKISFGDGATEVYRTSELQIIITAIDKESPIAALTPTVLVAKCGDSDWSTVESQPEAMDDYWLVKYVPPVDLEAGSYCFQAFVIDDQLDESNKLISEPIQILNNLPVVSSIDVNERAVLRLKSITLMIKGGDVEDKPGDLKLEVNYRLGAGGNWEAAYIEGIGYIPGGIDNDGTWSAKFTPTKSAKLGDYQFSARLTDKDPAVKPGPWFEVTSYVVEVKNNNPTPVIIPIKELTEGQSGTFDATGSKDLEDTGLSYTWDYGDKKTGKGLRASHSYSKAGKYTVTLTVSDSDEGKATTTTVVNVKPKSIIAVGGTGAASSFSIIAIVAIVVLVIIIAVLAVALTRRKKVKAAIPPPITQSGTTSLTALEDTNAPPTYHVEAYRVVDTENVVQSRTYGDEEMRRAYK